MSQKIRDLNLPNNIQIAGEILEGFLWGGRESGIAWLDGAPALIDAVCQKHKISDLRVSPEMRMNMVLFGESSIHGPVVLKAAPPHWEVTNEINAIDMLNLTGLYAPLIDADESAAWSLQVRLQPGEMLQTFAQSGEISDEEATRITAKLMKSTIQPVPTDSSHNFPDLQRWLKSLWDYEHSGKDTIPADQLGLALRHARELVADPGAPMLLHGDFHHGNILHTHDGWRVTDPKGILGDAAFEVGPFFYNPIGVDKRPHLADLFDRRLEIFSEVLGIDRLRLWKAALIGCVLSDCWSLEDGPVDHTHFDTVTAALMQLPERNA